MRFPRIIPGELYFCGMPKKIELQASDFRNMDFPCVMLPKSKSVISFFTPRLDFLNQYERPDYEVRLMLLLFDRNSPLSRIEDLSLRAYEACRFARIDFDRRRQEFPQAAVDIVSGKSDPFNQMVCGFLSLVYGSEYAMIRTMHEQRLNKLAKALAGESEAFKEEEELRVLISKKLNALVKFNHEPFMLNINQHFVDENLLLSAESVAFARKLGQSIYPEFSQYA